MFSLADVFEALTDLRPAIAPLVITEAAIDSRQVIPGGLFVAIPGERVDGHDFITQAFQRGAVAALVEREVEEPFALLDLRAGSQNTLPAHIQPPLLLRVENTVSALQKIAAFWRKKLNLRVVGITGSVGKSTTKEAVAQVLSQRYHTLKSIANLNNEIGLPLNVLRLTPGHQYAVLEMGFYVPGEIAQLCQIARPQIGVINNIGTVHAERAGSQEIIALGKGELVEALPAAPEGVAILNQDDPLVRPMAERTRARVFTYGLDPAANLWADEVVGLGLEGIRFRLHYGGESLHLRVPMIGRHSVHTALRAAAVGLVENLSWEEIVSGLQESQTQLRLVAVRSENGALLLDDTYNASPESTLAALTLLEELPARRIAVLGDMLELGPYEREGHEKVGARAAEVAETLVTLGVRAHLIAESARRAGMSRKNIHEYEERQEVIAWLRQNVQSGDSVLIKGSHGLHMERIVAALEVEQ
ncbi:MAG: UDP-N-acetylmuramoyl-tripeptide--D-alanyl-D-alanine ligase [Anaerolineales bacterium]